MKYFQIILLLLVLVFNLEKRLTILGGELRHHRARPEHIAVRHYVVAVDLGEDPPVLQLPIERLVMCPCFPLHCLILCRIRVVGAGTFDFVGVVAVPLVSLDPLARLEEKS